MEDAKRFNILLVVVGAILAVLGIVCMFWNAASLAVLTVLVGIGFLIAGISQLVIYIRYRASLGFSNGMLVESIINLVLGVLFTFMPGSLSNVIPWAIAACIIIGGAVLLFMALAARGIPASGKAGVIILAALMILFGVLMIVHPGIVAIIVGIYALLTGVSMIVSGATFGQLFW